MNVEQQRDYIQYHMRLGTVKAAKGWYDRAMESFKAVLRIDANYGLAHYNIGNVHRDLKNYDAAMNAYRRAISCGFMTANVYNNLGICLAHLGRQVKAREMWQKGLRLNPDHKLIRHNLNQISQTVRGGVLEQNLHGIDENEEDNQTISIHELG